MTKLRNTFQQLCTARNGIASQDILDCLSEAEDHPHKLELQNVCCPTRLTETLFDSLELSPGLVSLHMDSVIIGQHGAAALSKILGHHPLQNIKLVHCSISDEQGELICSNLQNSGVKSLNLTNNMCSGKTVRGLSASDSLVELILDYNPLKDKSIVELFSHLNHNTCLERLSLVGCGAGYKASNSLLQFEPLILSVLKLEHNNISEARLSQIYKRFSKYSEPIQSSSTNKRTELKSVPDELYHGNETNKLKAELRRARKTNSMYSKIMKQIPCHAQQTPVAKNDHDEDCESVAYQSCASSPTSFDIEDVNIQQAFPDLQLKQSYVHTLDELFTVLNQSIASLLERNPPVKNVSTSYIKPPQRRSVQNEIRNGDDSI